MDSNHNCLLVAYFLVRLVLYFFKVIVGLYMEISVPFLLPLLSQSCSCPSCLPHILPSAASYPDMNFSALDFIGLWQFQPFILTVSFQSPINLDWILPLSFRCSSQLDLRHQAMNIFGNWGISQVPGQSESSCFLSPFPSAISDSIWGL